MQPTAEQIKAASEVCADLVEQDPIGCWQDAPTEVIDSLAVLAKAYLNTANPSKRLKPLDIPPMEMQPVIGYAECLPTCCIKTVLGSYHVVGDGWYFMSSDNRQRHVRSNELCVKEIVADYERRVSELFEEAT